MEAPSPPGVISRVTDAELELVPMNLVDQTVGEQAVDGVGAGLPEVSGYSNSNAYMLSTDVAEQKSFGPEGEEGSNFLLKAKLKDNVRRARTKVRHNHRALDIAGLERDCQLYPHLLKEEISGLGKLFDAFATADKHGELYIDHTGVGLMMTDALRYLYDKVDLNRNGELDKNEVAALLDSLNHPTTASELDVVMSQLDTGGNGTVDFREFKQWWTQRQYETSEDQARELQDLFVALDHDGSGKIDWHEFLELIACV